MPFRPTERVRAGWVSRPLPKMSSKRTVSLMNSWDTIRCELLNTPICDLGLRIEGSPVEPFVRRLHGELAGHGLDFQPACYLTDSWGCPDEVPVIGIPFYLADKRLLRIEEEQTGEVEAGPFIMMLLRHEAGHAVNYAYRLMDEPEWADTFGPFTRPYRDSFRPNPQSRQFVRHIPHHLHGRTYAQKHPDEDFAETFAVWLTPRSGWRRRYHNWPALRKLQYVDAAMRRVRGQAPKRTGGPLCTPVEEMALTLARHYGQRADRYLAAQGYIDDELREVFPPVRGQAPAPAALLFRENRAGLIARAARWSGLEPGEVGAILDKLQDRAEALGLVFHRRDRDRKLMDATALATALAMNFGYTGYLTG